jgi:hypothetical protein
MKTLIILISLLWISNIESLSINLKTKNEAKPFSSVKRYTVSGIISLPYAEINEPFKAWLDVDQYSSRIDYYDGMVSTIQLAPTSDIDYGTGIKIAPMTGKLH